MANGVLVIVSSGSEAKEKAITGMRFAINAKKHGFVEKVELMLFGPSEEMFAKGDEELSGMLKEAIDLGILPVACSGIANRKNITDPLKKIGVSVDPVGPILGAYIKKDYQVLTF